MFATSCIAGNLVADPELKTVGSKNTSLAKFTIAVNERVGDDEKVYYFQCQAWGNRAEAIAKAFSKGSRIAVGCDMRQDAWEDKSTGQKRRKDVHNVTNIMFPSRGSSGEPRTRTQTKDEVIAQIPMATGPGSDIDDDDIPF